MRYPTIDNYTETILNPKGRFRTLESIEAIKKNDGTLKSDQGSHHINFHVMINGQEHIITCRLRKDDDGRIPDEILVKCLGDIKSRCLAECSLLTKEMYVFGHNGEGGYYDIMLTRCPEGMPIHEAMARIARTRDSAGAEKLLRNFLSMTKNMVEERTFSHNNIKPKYICVSPEYGTSLIDYRFLTVPSSGQWENTKRNDDGPLALISLALYALYVRPEIFSGKNKEWFAGMDNIKEFVSAIYQGFEKKPVFNTLTSTAKGDKNITPSELAEALDGLLKEESPLFASLVDPAANSAEKYESKGKYFEGLACAVSEGRYGYIDKNDNIAIPFIYDWAGDFEEGLAIIYIREGEGKNMGVIDKSGKEVLALEYEDISWLADNGTILACRYGKWRFYNRDGELISRTVLDNIGDFSSSLAWAMKDGKYGYVDRQGKVVIPMIYDDASSFNNEGFAPVRLGKHKYVINTNGEIVAES